MTNEDISSLTQRLERIEQLLARIPKPQVDPSPIDLTRFRDWRLIDLLRRWSGPFTDPAPGWPILFDPAPEDWVNIRLRDLLPRLSRSSELLNTRLIDLVRHIPGGGVTDPAPEDWANIRLRDLLQRIPGGGVADPSPEDIAHFNPAELEAQLHKINAELIRLGSLEKMIKTRLTQLKPKAG